MMTNRRKITYLFDTNPLDPLETTIIKHYEKDDMALDSKLEALSLQNAYVTFGNMDWQCEVHGTHDAMIHDSYTMYFRPILSDRKDAVYYVITATPSFMCDCGADRVGSPGHAHWCNHQ